MEIPCPIISWLVSMCWPDFSAREREITTVCISPRKAMAKALPSSSRRTYMDSRSKLGAEKGNRDDREVADQFDLRGCGTIQQVQHAGSEQPDEHGDNQ